MSLRITVGQLREQLPTVLDQAVKNGEVCIIERDGEELAVIVNAREWRRRTLGRHLDALGPEYRLAKGQQRRAEELLTKSERGRLTHAQRRELNALLRQCDDIMLRRAEAMPRVL
jgi:PHD/YefM family antitoxin component YafN of YafNO toxin-antitoxin module